EGRGTTFDVTVKLRDQEACRVLQMDDLQNRHLIVASGNAPLRDSLLTWATHCGLQVAAAHDVSGMFAHLGARAGHLDPTFVWLDADLPQADQAAQRLATMVDERRVLLAVLQGTRDGPTNPFASLQVARIGKPVRVRALLHALRQMAGSRSNDEPQTASAVAGTAQRVLVVEDNPINQKVALAMLRSLGMQTAAAASGEEALALLAEQDYDLILLDMQMPGMDGPSTARAIRASDSQVRRRDVPIVALTANVLTEHRATCMAAGMNDFLGKPLRKRDLEETLLRNMPSPPPR